MKALLRKIRQILRDRKTRRIFTRLVSTVAAIVVFVTTYALVLPAITMESEAACGIEAHQHDQSCYTDVLVCELPESPGHVHDESCYSKKQKMVCQQDEHTHDSDCYDENGELICEKTEHQHGEDCFEEVRELVCEIPESPGHQHNDSCYQKVLTCGKEVHTHSTACYHVDTASQAATEAIAVASTESAANSMVVATETSLDGSLNAPTEYSEPENSLGSSTENSVVESGLDASTDKRESGSGSNPLTDEVGGNEQGAWTSTEAVADATVGTTASAGTNDAMSAAAGYVPVLDELDFKTLLNKNTGIYYSWIGDADSAVDNETDGKDAAAGIDETQAQDSDAAANISGTQVQEVQESEATTNKNKAQAQESASAANTDEIQSPEPDTMANADEAQKEAAAENTGETQEPVAWNRIDKHTELKESDNLRLYLAYTIPAGSLNETNETARYSLPENIHLTDEQVDEINNTVNGIAGQYVSYDTLEILDQEMYGKYLGVEAVEGTRTPADDLDEYLANNDGQEFISATVKVENVIDENTGLLKAQDLIFNFAPYTIQKNQHQYDSEGQPTKAGEEVNGWLAIDISTEQIGWEKADDGAQTADIIFVEKDKKSDLKEISTEVRFVGAEVESDTDTSAGNAANGVSSDATATDNKQDGTKDSEAAVGESDKAKIEPVSYPSVSFNDSITVTGGSLSTDTDAMPSDAGIAAETELTVHVEADEDTFPEGTTMVLSAVSDEQMTAVAEAVEGAVDAPKTMGFHAVDISFRDVEGNEIEPLKPIRVSMTSDAIKRAVEDVTTAPVVVHVSDIAADVPAEERNTDNGDSKPAAVADEHTDDGNSEPATAADEGADDGEAANVTDSDEVEGAADQHITEPSETSADQASDNSPDTPAAPAATIIETDTGTKENNGDTLTFDAEAFSVYAVVYTVDFHYEINGKMYDFSIPGGGFVSLEHVVEVLGIATSDENTENGAENAENGAEGGEEYEGEVPGVDVSGENGTAYEEAIKLNEVEVSEATKKFVADVESVEFSSPELVWVGKVDDEVTVGGLKEANRLEVEYSAELTEEQIAEINGQLVEAGDWALISVQPFSSEETLTVTMKNGEVFTIRVTDDNDPLGLNGRTFALLAFNGVHALMRNNNSIGSLGINKSVGTDYAFSGGKDYIRQDATAWEFKYNSEKQAYQISNNGQYLSINPNGTSGAPALVTDATAASTWIKITRDESGNYYLGNEMGAFIYDNNGTFALTTNSSDNRTAFHMCLPENPDGSHKATLTAAKDLSVGQTIVIYQKVWNSQTDEYDYYAIDGNGKLQKVWDSSDSLYWKEDISIEWELREETDSDGIPTGYLQLYNKKTGTYLAPKSSGTGFAATHAASSITAQDMKKVRVSLPGRDAGDYSSRIATWDYDDNTTYGLVVNYDPTNTTEPYTLGVKELLQSNDFLFAVRDPLVQKQLTTVDTVDSASKGIKMTMYDFDGAKRGTQELYYMTDVIGEYFYSNGYTFTDSTKAGKQHPTLVTRVLGEDGFPVSAINNKSLGMIFYPPAGASSHGTSYTVARTDDVNHLFLQSVYDSTGFYYYSCFDNYARLKTGSKDFEVYEQVGSPRDASQFFFNRGNFMPYNDLDLTTVKKNLYVGDQNNTQYDDAYPRKQEDLYIIKGGQNGADYFFGMTMEAKFQQGANGVSENGDPIVYDFNGDDDLWIYVDDVLLMDIGGVHDAIHGTINFSTGKITVYNTDNNGTEHPSTTYIKDQFWQAHRFPDGSLWTEEMGPDHPKANEFFTDGGKTSDGKLIGTFKEYSTHDFKMFYMERGGGASNLQINFNLPVITRDEFRVTKKMLTTATGQPIQSAYADAAFYYKAYIKQGDNWVEYKKSDYPSGTTAVYDDEKRTPVVWKEIIDPDTGEVTGYSDTIFEVKPGQTAVIPVADSQVEYKVVEVEPEPGLSHMLDNFNVSNSDQDPNDSKSTVGKTVKRRGQVFFDNKPIDEIVNELRITKNLHGDLYRNSSTNSGYVEDQNGSPYFEYRIFLEATSGQLVPYSLGEYYQIDGSEEHKGQYVYYDKGERLYATVNGSGQYVYTYPNSGKPTDTLSEPKITEHTSQNGSLGDVRPGDTIIVKGLLEGTDFVVDERLDRTHMRQKDAATDDGWEADWDNKYYFSHTDVEGAMERGTDGNPTADTRPDNYEIAGTLFDRPINDGELNVSGNEARGTIVTNKDAEVVVHNEVYNQFELPVEKKWSSDFNMSSLGNAEVTFTLKRMKLEERKGAFTLKAMPSGVPEGFDPEYIFTKSTGEIFTVKLSEMSGSNDTYTKTFSLPIGTYSVSYGDAPVGYDVAYSPESASVTVSSDNSENGAAASPSVITLADTYTRQTGSIQVTKNLKGYHGNNSFENFTATYTVTDTAGRAVQDANNQEVQSVTLHYSDFFSGKAEINFNNLPAGQYLVRETIASSSYNNDKYTVVNTADPESGIVTVTRGNPATMTCTSTYTEVKSNPVQIIVKETEYGRNNTLYSNNSSFRPGDRVIITFVHQNNNNALKYRVNNGEWITVSTTGNGGSVTDEIRMTVPDNGITVEFKDGWSQMKADNINVIKDQGVVANRISAMGTSNTASARMMMRAPRLAAGSSTNNTPSASNDAPLPSVQDTQMFSPDSWQLIVTMKNGGDLLDSDGHKIGSFTGNGNNTWSVTLKGAGFDGLTGTDEDGNLYYYYIDAITEKNVPDGTTPSIATEENGDRYLYSRTDQATNTGRVLRAENELITKVSIGIQKTDDHGNPIEEAVFKLVNGSEIVSISASGDGVIVHAVNTNESVTIKDNTFTVPKGGVIIDGIPSSNNKYKIVEVSSPPGFIINDNEPVEFEVKAGRLTETHKTGVSFSSTGNVFTIPNTPGAALPNTGGPGTRLFTILGSILILGAGVLLWRRRRMI